MSQETPKRKKPKLNTLEETLENILRSNPSRKLKKITGENFDVDYGVILPKTVADEIFKELEQSVEYYDGELSKVKIFGKSHFIPRQQVAFGDEGMKYKFSGVTVPAKNWSPLLKTLRKFLLQSTGHQYNFVLVNRYRNGKDHIGEHRDDEKDLDENVPIASLSFGQRRTFVFKHRDCRKKGPDKRDIATVKIELEHGSLLMMNPPVNRFWYHSLPPRKSATGVRINLTFRKINL